MITAYFDKNWKFSYILVFKYVFICFFFSRWIEVIEYISVCISLTGSIRLNYLERVDDKLHFQKQWGSFIPSSTNSETILSAVVPLMFV